MIVVAQIMDRAKRGEGVELWKGGLAEPHTQSRFIRPNHGVEAGREAIFESQSLNIGLFLLIFLREASIVAYSVVAYHEECVQVSPSYSILSSHDSRDDQWTVIMVAR
jgi:hypothetical protein